MTQTLVNKSFDVSHPRVYTIMYNRLQYDAESALINVAVRTQLLLHFARPVTFSS